MSKRRKPRKLSAKKSLSAQKYKRINRYSKSKRGVPYQISYKLPERQSRRNKITKRIGGYLRKQIVRKPTLLPGFVNRAIYYGGKLRCKEKEQKDDMSRRREFFKSKSKGNSSKRPEHKQKYKRCK